ncbi:MAG TPA: DUF2088 domain-containing protein [Candidatus Avipropionibacterium avicola]|uniref:DUF2088 domain-containing protein n=1 Tax=Candidatus Avipropionibacterium avicola TaxID=2840701 RepID=A0A9D1GZM0_9ACTN|nr:DUF2088 domain-containing protein [Candidatus Avipropionibacterium avicola]
MDTATASTVPSGLIGGPHQHVSADELDAFVRDQLGQVDLDGKSVTLVIPDGTRSCPLPLLLRTLHRHVVERAADLVAVIALGTHSYMETDEIERMVGAAPGELDSTYPGMRIVNHEWADPDMLVNVGSISGERISELSEGRLDVGADILINRHVVESDVSIVVGPVFPHEVVGISGGNKYYIPGVASQEFIDMTHWVGALITSYDIIGTTGITPVRAMINEGAQLIPGLRLGLCLVVESGSGEIEAVGFGTTERAWELTAPIAAETHVTYVEEPFQRVVSMMPERYEDIWTAAKGFYKLEPAVADGGEVIIYAPHVTEVSEVHHEILEIGYHCRDYFVTQWDKFSHIHWGVLAHSTHLRGKGTYDPATGEENLRVKVTLATQIPREVCESINLGYLDPASLDLDAMAAEPGTVVIPNAGEILYRVRD